MQTATYTRNWEHTHVFDEGNPLAERNTRWALALTVVMMLAEITGGWLYNSMALLADGWHMSSHALALGLSALAYAAARRLSDDGRFTFGTWKIEVLGGYTIEAKVRSVMFGLGFKEDDLARCTTEFSGGWQMRIALAKLLIITGITTTITTMNIITATPPLMSGKITAIITISIFAPHICTSWPTRRPRYLPFWR